MTLLIPKILIDSFKDVLDKEDIIYELIDNSFYIPNSNSEGWDLTIFKIGREYQRLFNDMCKPLTYEK